MMIARSVYFVSVLSLSCIWGSAAESSAGEREEILDYLKKNAIGRTLEHNSIFKIAEGKIETVFTRRTTFSGLIETPLGFAFDELIVINQVLYDLDEAGKRSSTGRKEDRVLVVRHEYRVRESTNRLVGLSRVISNSKYEPTGSANLERISLKNSSLVIDVTGLGYDDYFAPGGKYVPAISDSQGVFTLREGKLHRVTRYTSYDVDPDTLKRTKERLHQDDLVDQESVSDTSPVNSLPTLRDE
jgi:hypothetical protein